MERPPEATPSGQVTRAESLRRTAVIGSGVAGLTAAHILSEAHDVTLYEAEDRLGGHAHTHELTASDGRTHRVDSGFTDPADQDVAVQDTAQMPGHDDTVGEALTLRRGECVEQAVRCAVDAERAAPRCRACWRSRAVIRSRATASGISGTSRWMR